LWSSKRERNGDGETDTGAKEFILDKEYKNKYQFGRAIAQTVSRWLSTAAAKIETRV
jgi:hypothetical protein